MEKILKYPPTIQTQRLTIRPLMMADAEAIFLYASDPEVTKYVLFETHLTIEDSKEFVQKALDLYEKQEPCPLAITLTDDQQLIGTIGYHLWSERNKRIEIGYALAKPYWNKGIITEAARALVDTLFNETDLIRIEAHCDVENGASARVMEKIGMQFEGIFRKHSFTKGRFHDMKVYSILRDEWERKNNH